MAPPRDAGLAGYDPDDDRLLVNTEREGQKEVNVRDDPLVAIGMTDADNPYRMLTAQGTAEELTRDGAREHIKEMAHRYVDEEEYPNPIQTERVIISIRPEDVSYQAP